jgi:hypothetical protein
MLQIACYSFLYLITSQLSTASVKYIYFMTDLDKKKNFHKLRCLTESQHYKRKTHRTSIHRRAQTQGIIAILYQHREQHLTIPGNCKSNTGLNKITDSFVQSWKSKAHYNRDSNLCVHQGDQAVFRLLRSPLQTILHKGHLNPPSHHIQNSDLNV